MAEAAGDIFGPINAETGDVSQFTGVTVAGSVTFAAAAGAALHGNYGFLHTGDGAVDSGYGTKTFTDKTLIYTRFYLKFHADWAATETALRYIAIQHLWDDAKNVAYLRIKYDNTTSELSWYRLTHLTDGDTANNIALTGGVVALNTLYRVDLYWKAGDGDGATEVWLDGVSMGAAASLANSSYAIDSADLGYGFGSNCTPDNGALTFFDDFKAATTLIGAYSESSGSVVPLLVGQYNRRRR